MGVLSSEGVLVPDPAWVSRYHTAAHRMLRCASLHPTYQAWRQYQVLQSYDRLGWRLPRGSLPGVWAVVGNGPGAHVPPGADYVLAINGALELAPQADLWMVADALRPTNSWGAVLPEWIAQHRATIERATMVARVTARHDLAAIAREVHYYLPCTQEHRDIIPEHIAARMPTMIDGLQSLPAAMHIAWWLGATRILLAGAPQGLPVDSMRYYEASATPIPPGRLADSVLVPGVDGLMRTTSAHMHAHREADMVCWWLRRQGCEVADHSRGLIYRCATVGDPA
jgi:hypothetical protein